MLFMLWKLQAATLLDIQYDTTMQRTIFLLHFVSLRSGILESALCVRPSVLPVCAGSDLRNCSMDFLDTWHDDRPIGPSFLFFVPKLDIFTYKSSLSVDRLPNFSEMVYWGNILLTVYISVLWPIYQGHQRSLNCQNWTFLLINHHSV